MIAKHLGYDCYICGLTHLILEKWIHCKDDYFAELFKEEHYTEDQFNVSVP